MIPLSRRLFCRLAFFGPLASAVPPTDSEPSAALLASQGVRMLREGRTFEKAAAHFARAGEMEPLNPDYQIALGCAYASRAASLSHAALFTQRLAREWAEYPTKVEAWEAGRASWESQKTQYPQAYASENYEDRKPKSPPLYEFVTKDDQLPFRLTLVQAAVRLSELSREAQKAWKTGISLSQTPETKAGAFYVQAWGLAILRLALSGDDKGESTAPPAARVDDDAVGENVAAAAPGKPSANTPAAALAVKAAEEAARLAPENALYLRAIGDLLWDAEEKKAFAAYEKALALAPKDRNLLYLLYQKTIAKALKEREAPQWVAYTKGEVQKPDVERFAVPMGYLRRVSVHDGASAWALYEEAGLLFCLAPYARMGGSGSVHPTPEEAKGALYSVVNADARKRGKRAIDLIVQGNGLPHYNTPEYEPSVPPLLKSALDYTANPWSSGELIDLFAHFALLRELARAVGGYGHVMAENENRLPEAVRASRAAAAMGLHVMGERSVKKNLPDARTMMQTLVGWAVVTISSRNFVKMYQKIGDKSSADAVQKELNDFQADYEVYQKAIAPLMENAYADY